MATVFFKTNDALDQEVEQFMKEEGYTNKAEFFRFLVKFFKYHRLEKATQELGETLKKLDKKGMLGRPLKDQLADV